MATPARSPWPRITFKPLLAVAFDICRAVGESATAARSRLSTQVRYQGWALTAIDRNISRLVAKKPRERYRKFAVPVSGIQSLFIFAASPSSHPAAILDPYLGHF
ncbi:hypothetical protein BGZ61DRAFT_481567 [Ilyonectria robusta]|uniref:uncharacterized protein n=1 Tax=Ilyonectria robusta TaxID=1079257 RepID=UPI001E8ED579|nr:uncharacterized protein BGZ61DRAFT_481567 [Ilyonectria robusta]KAH8676937.1 hypothetical protein BGZ61DRAFT_481567 [Ilyonectria robusta]